MWESRVLCEISKVRWKSFCDFHGTGISIAVSGVHAENVGAAASLDRPGCPREDAIDRIEGKGLSGCPRMRDPRDQIDGSSRALFGVF